MKKLLILTTLTCGLLTACSNNSNKEAETPPVSEQETMAADSTLMNPDSTKEAADKMTKDSTEAAHGHSH